jgi:ferritin-like metal-binding protein YciE
MVEVVAEDGELPPMPRSTDFKSIPGGNMSSATLHTLYVNELKDLYSAEHQLVKALPKMVKSAESEELSDAFANHLEQTKNHVTRLEDVFENLQENPKGKKCVGMEGIIKEGAEVIDEFDGKVLDAGLISAAQRVEHYEIAAYGSVCAFAEKLGRSEDLGLLKETLEEEKQADEQLTELSETIDSEARALSPDEHSTRKGAGRTGKSKSRSAA